MRVIFCLPIVINPYSFMVHILRYACGIDFNKLYYSYSFLNLLQKLGILQSLELKGRIFLMKLALA